MGAKQKMICPKCVKYIYKDYDEKYYYCPICNEYYEREEYKYNGAKNWW